MEIPDKAIQIIEYQRKVGQEVPKTPDTGK